LGGCESLIEWRAGIDSSVHPGLCRLSIGLEDVEDLKNDLVGGFNALLCLVPYV
jgi:cystathionine gamma-synthase